jgi:hypothetical protein
MNRHELARNFHLYQDFQKKSEIRKVPKSHGQFRRVREISRFTLTRTILYDNTNFFTSKSLQVQVSKQHIYRNNLIRANFELVYTGIPRI